jgi:hypothetical protein
MDAHNQSTSLSYTKSCGSRNGNGGNGDHSPLPLFLLTGRTIFARTNRGIDERAGLSGQLVTGEVQLTSLTVPQAAAITHSITHRTYAALQLAPASRARVAKGEVSLADALKGNGLVAAWLMATADERAALGAIVGVDEVWDDAIKPAI